jgi:hypothetical protein
MLDRPGGRNLLHCRYANGLECFGSQQSPLEAMACEAETAFASSTAFFDVEKMVAEKLGL